MTRSELITESKNNKDVNIQRLAEDDRISLNLLLLNNQKEINKIKRVIEDILLDPAIVLGRDILIQEQNLAHYELEHKSIKNLIKRYL